MSDSPNPANWPPEKFYGEPAIAVPLPLLLVVIKELKRCNAIFVTESLADFHRIGGEGKFSPSKHDQTVAAHIDMLQRLIEGAKLVDSLGYRDFDEELQRIIDEETRKKEGLSPDLLMGMDDLVFEDLPEDLREEPPEED